MRRIGLGLILLLLGAAVTFAQDYVPNDMGAITVEASAQGEFEAGVRDQYTLDIAEDGLVNVFLDGTADTDTYLRVYRNGDDVPLAENDDRGDCTLFSAVTDLAVEAGDSLIIEVGTYGDTGAGPYTLRVVPPAAVVDFGEISLDEVVEGVFTPNERQRYTLTLTETTALRVLLESADADAYLRLYADAGDAPQVQSSDISAEDTSAGFEALVVPGGTTLVIEVATAGDGGAGDYTLTVETAAVDLPVMAEAAALSAELPVDVCAEAADTPEPTRLQYFAPEEVLQPGVDYGAIFCTAAGNFHVDLYETEAPITVNSFVYLALNHFFDNTTFHRVIPDFVVQGGDPLGTGLGGPGYEFVNETDNELTFNGIGVVGMANAGPDTNGSQFFITLAPVGRLTGGYTIFGQVLEGMGSVFDIAERDPETATEPGTILYRVVIVTANQT
ncbi:peptidylprolyl isomerase [Candidatus Flexifilum breve]|uniref:peptidylprolyl isomerase n=1 Tax=Candidatus Flexifilum breve TaxID=3140694 RepID=UPI0031CC3A43